ncbi:hypothetical protein LTR70_002579 [Exophiala xenobiotica]|nr:hypothetical protein LTR70_002579 [Exophiala xenobiotica]
MALRDRSRKANGMAYNNDRLPNEILKIIMEHVSYPAAGLPVLWRDLVHSQPERDARRTRKLVKSIEQSAAAQHMASLTIEFASTPTTEFWDMCRTFKNLHRLQTLAVAFRRDMRADVVIGDLEALAESIPPTLQNLEIKVRVGAFLISDETLSLACSAAISTAARQLKRLRLDLPANSIKIFSPNSWLEHYPYLQELCIIIGSPEDNSSMKARVIKNTLLVARDTNTAINSAIEQGRLPKLSAGSITAVISNMLRREPLRDVPSKSTNRNGILHRGFSKGHSKAVAVYPIMRVLSRSDIFWVQVLVAHERFKIFETQRSLVSKSIYRDVATGHMFHHVQVMDTIEHILDLLESGIWVVSLAGSRMPLSVLGELGGRCYAVRSRRPEEEQKHHDYIMAELAPWPDVAKWYEAQARDDSEFDIMYFDDAGTHSEFKVMYVKNQTMLEEADTS